jgi:hypothetical protein
MAISSTAQKGTAVSVPVYPNATRNGVKHRTSLFGPGYTETTYSVNANFDDVLNFYTQRGKVIGGPGVATTEQDTVVEITPGDAKVAIVKLGGGFGTMFIIKTPNG